MGYKTVRFVLQHLMEGFGRVLVLAPVEQLDSQNEQGVQVAIEESRIVRLDFSGFLEAFSRQLRALGTQESDTQQPVRGACMR